MSGFVEQALTPWRRAVLKVGSSLLAADGGGLSTRHALGLAEFIAACHRKGREVVLVSSGAVAAGRATVHGVGQSAPLAAKQALAAIGQTQMVALWQRFFDRPVAQVLLTHDDLRNRRRYLNARATLRELLVLGALPVVNENDTVAVDELKLGDNDNLAAIVAALVDADVLLIATDIDGLYSANPRSDATARPIPAVTGMTPDIMAMAGGAGSQVGTGGMRTKLEAAGKAGAAGIETVLFNGTDAAVLRGLAHDRLCGTRLHASGSRMAARKYWLRHAPGQGVVRVDSGAAQALARGGASLLPSGVLAAEGEFARGDVVEIVCEEGPDQRQTVARGIVQYSAVEVRRLARRHTREIADLLGYSYGENIVHRDDLVLTQPQAQAQAV